VGGYLFLFEISQTNAMSDTISSNKSQVKKFEKTACGNKTKFLFRLLTNQKKCDIMIM